METKINFSDTHSFVAVNDHHGIYVGQVLAQSYDKYLLDAGIKQEDINILLSGPDHDEYLEVWSEVLPTTITDDKGDKYVLDTVGESGDIWAIPENEFNLIDWDNI